QIQERRALMPQTCQLGTKEIFYSSQLVHFFARSNEAVRCNTGSSQNLSIRCNFIFSRGRTHIQGLHIVHIVVSECRAFVFQFHILRSVFRFSADRLHRFESLLLTFGFFLFSLWLVMPPFFVSSFALPN